LATSFVLATPTDAVRPTSALVSSLIRPAIVGPSPKSAAEPVTSRKASSIEIGSTSGVKRRRIAMTSRLTRWYFAPSTGTKIASGQSRLAVRIGIAEWIPKRRASYEAALTTPRSLLPPTPTTTGLPRSSG